jgi:thymidylate synthase
MQNYHDLLKDILENGETKDDRTGVGTVSLFGRQLRFDLRKGFPAITTKKLAWKAVVGELLWFVEGSRDERRLAEITHGSRDGPVTIWTPNALASYWKPKAKFDGDLGRVYGVQWRDWKHNTLKSSKHHVQHANSDKTHYDSTVMEKSVDQLKNLLEGLQADPNGRRHVVISYNPGEIEQMALPPCHVMFQMYVSNNKLSCQMYQRSGDSYLGIPFNIASYALLTHMIAQVCNLEVGELILVFGDVHIYKNHIDQVNEILTREPMKLPKLWLNPEIKDINKFTMDDIKLIDYKSHPALKAPMAV